MIKSILFAFILGSLFSVTILGQSNKAMDKATYKAEFDSLSLIKNSLAAVTKNYKSEIDSLTDYLKTLDEKLSGCQQDLTQIKQQYYIKKYGKKNGERVSSGMIWKGMTENMLQDSWGKPDKKTKNVEKWGVFTQLYYGEVTFYFRDHVLTGWEEKGGNSNLKNYILH